MPIASVLDEVWSFYQYRNSPNAIYKRLRIPQSNNKVKKKFFRIDIIVRKNTQKNPEPLARALKKIPFDEVAEI